MPELSVGLHIALTEQPYPNDVDTASRLDVHTFSLTNRPNGSAELRVIVSLESLGRYAGICLLLTPDQVASLRESFDKPPL